MCGAGLVLSTRLFSCLPNQAIFKPTATKTHQLIGLHTMNNKLYRKQIPSTHAMRCFEAAARHLSFTLAAEELNMTQSAVSKQVAMLEYTLKIQLFIRIRQRLQLSPPGQLYLQEVTHILNLIEDASLEMLSYGNRTESIRIATHPSFGTNWLIPTLQGFAQQYPHLELVFQDYVEPTELNDTDVDVAFIHGNGHWDKLTTIKLFDEIMVPVCSAGLWARYQQEESNSIYFNEPLLHCRTRVGAWPEFFSRFEIEHPNGYRGTRFETWTSVLAAAEHDFGIALVPEFLAHNLLLTGRLIRLGTQQLDESGAYYIAYPEHYSAEPKIVALSEWITERTLEKNA
jgi:LysR family glycine cleavage system transcriptional activator